MVDISFLITVHNEDTDLERLLLQLCTFLEQTKSEDEIVVLDDYSDNPETLYILEKYSSYIKVVKHKLQNSFGNHKQFGNTQCTKKYILQIDADEYLNTDFLYNIKSLLESNPDPELFMVPRVNRLDGLTAHHVSKWGWRLSTMDGVTQKRKDICKEELELITSNNLLMSNEDGYVTFKSILINWPDYQFRLYKNLPHIKWERDLHELIVGAEKVTYLPNNDYTWALFHDKTIDKQEKQNMFYMSNFSKELNVRK